MGRMLSPAGPGAPALPAKIFLFGTLTTTAVLTHCAFAYWTADRPKAHGNRSHAARNACFAASRLATLPYCDPSLREIRDPRTTESHAAHRQLLGCIFNESAEGVRKPSRASTE